MPEGMHGRHEEERLKRVEKKMMHECRENEQYKKLRGEVRMTTESPTRISSWTGTLHD